MNATVSAGGYGLIFIYVHLKGFKSREIGLLDTICISIGYYKCFFIWNIYEVFISLKGRKTENPRPATDKELLL